MTNFLPKHATVLEACEWLATETGEPWTLTRLLENSLTPWVWLDYEPRFPEIFGDRLEGFSTPMLFHGDVARLAAGGDNVLLTMIQAPGGKPPIRLMPGYSTGIDDLRFLRDDITRLAGKSSGPARHGTPPPTVGNVEMDKNDRQPRWNKWRLMPEVKIWEAVALSLNIEPDKIKTIPDAWMGASHPFDEGDEFNDRLSALQANLSPLNHDKPFLTGVRLNAFASWALSDAEWSIPDELKNLAANVTPNPIEHESLAVYQYSEKLPVSVVVAEMKKDPTFVTKALQILSVEDVGSTHSNATAVSGLINHWMVNRDLPCYIRNERVDVAALTVLPVEGDYGKGIDALENWMTIDKEELAALLEKRGLPPPAFLRQKFEAEVSEPVSDKGLAKTNKLIWDDARLRALYEESILPGVTKTNLGNKYGVSRQRIGKLLNEAEGKFGIAKQSKYSQLMPGNRINKGTKY